MQHERRTIMNFAPNPNNYERVIRTIDAHTVGEAARIIMDGFPPIYGDTMMAKKQYIESHYDDLRSALMLEPRGHNDMFGAIFVEPVHDEADLGVIFMDNGGYLNMCGHGSIGASTVAVETGIVPVTEPYTTVVLDTPAGVIYTEVAVAHGRAKEVSISNVPSFLYKDAVPVEVPGYGVVNADISFGGSFFALVDAGEIGWAVHTNNIPKFVDLGMKLRREINRTVQVQHPYLDIDTVDLVEFYKAAGTDSLNQKNIVVFGNGQVDRSPCGTGTSAKIADLYAKGKLQLNQEIINESVIGSVFRGAAVLEVEIGGYAGVVPRITGSANIVGYNQWLIDSNDPLNLGFAI
jgi:proline racemase